jgi:predicted ferric reductase
MFKGSRMAVGIAVVTMLHVLLVAPWVFFADIIPTSLGAFTLSALAFSLLLAARFKVVDTLLGGPDKSYEAHSLAGVMSVVGLVGHWMLASDVGRGIIPQLAESGETAGVIAAFAMIGLAFVSAIRAIPYHIWKVSHWLMGPMFGFAVYHTFFTATTLAVLSPPLIFLAAASAIGFVAWVRTLSCHRKGNSDLRVVSVATKGRAAELTLQADTDLLAYRPGQFAMLSDPKRNNERHPFSIAVGDLLTLGVPEGRFYPKTSAERPAQLWVAGGIGITPFLASLEAMTPDDAAQITLVYCYRGVETAIGIDVLRVHATRLPQLRLIGTDSALGCGLTAQTLRAIAGTMPQRSDLYMCGAEALKGMVADVWTATGNKGRIHTETFDFRGAWGWADVVASTQKMAPYMGAILRWLVNGVPILINDGQRWWTTLYRVKSDG